MNKIKWYIQDWWYWAKRCNNDWKYKILVLLRLAHSPSFEFGVRGLHESLHELYGKDREND